MMKFQVWAALALLLVSHAMAEAPMKRRVAPLEVAVQVGFDHRSRGTVPGTWAPVAVWVTNHTDKDLHGTARFTTVDTSGTPGGSRVSRPVALPAGRTTPVRTTVFVAPGDTRLDVQIVTGSGETASVSDSLLAAPRLMRSVVVVGEARRDAPATPQSSWSPTYPHDALARVGHSLRLTGVPLVGQPLDEWQYGEPVRWQVWSAVAEDLPDRWIGYGAVSAIVVADPAVVDRLEPDQWSAIQEFVRSGGTLVIETAGESAVAARESKRLRSLLPALIGATRTVSRRDLFRALELSNAPEGDVSITDLQALPSATAHRAHDISSWVSGSYGLGTVNVLSFSLGEDMFTRDESTLERLSSQVLGTQNDDFERQPNAGNLIRQVDFDIKSEELDQIPSHRVLLVFLLAYCLCIGPANRLLFGGSRRPLRPWAVLPFIVLGFVGIAMNQLGIKRPEVPLMREVAVLQARSGDADALARSYLSLYSPDRATYRLDYARKGTAIQFLAHSEHRGLDREALSYADGVGPDQLDPASAPAWRESMQKYALDGLTLAPRSRANLSATLRVPLDGTITLTSDYSSVASVTNALKVPVQGGLFLAASGSQYDLPAMAPGETVTLGKLAAGRSVQDLLARTGRDRRMVENLLTQLRNPSRRPAVLLWTNSSFTDLAATSPNAPVQPSALTFLLVSSPPPKGDR